MTTVATKRMPDGRICRSGPTCRLHGSGASHGSTAASSIGLDLAKAKKALSDKLQALPFPEGNKRAGLNTSDPDWAQELYDESRAIEKLMTVEGEKYPRNNAINQYRTTGYIETNSYLREGEEGIKKEIIKEGFSVSYRLSEISKSVERSERRIKEIDEWFEHEQTWDEPKLLYRGVEVEKEKLNGKTIFAYAKDEYKEGMILEEKAYASTSADPDYMLFFARGRKKKRPHVVYEILATKGLPVMEDNIEDVGRPRSGDIQSYEREVLLNRGTKFRVAKVKRVEFSKTWQQEKNDYGYASSCHYRDDCPDKHTFTVVQLEQIV